MSQPFDSVTRDSGDAVLKLSEIFQSIQGEGVSAGAPCLFLRLALCNLHCRWCDTKYSWDFKNYRYEDEVRVQAVPALAARILESRARRLVITGGEPLLQQPALARLLERLEPGIAVEVETNGTLEPCAELTARVDQWNVSPKLSNGGDDEALRIRLGALSALLATGRAWLKLVVRDRADAAEADALVRTLAWPADRVLLMAEAATREMLQERGPEVAHSAVELGYRYSPRLHVELWGGRRGT